MKELKELIELLTDGEAQEVINYIEALSALEEESNKVRDLIDPGWIKPVH